MCSGSGYGIILCNEGDSPKAENEEREDKKEASRKSQVGRSNRGRAITRYIHKCDKKPYNYQMAALYDREGIKDEGKRRLNKCKYSLIRSLYVKTKYVLFTV